MIREHDVPRWLKHKNKFYKKKKERLIFQLLEGFMILKQIETWNWFPRELLLPLIFSVNLLTQAPAALVSCLLSYSTNAMLLTFSMM